ncbi:NADH-quinone oxidoreductase subunit NuoF [candidate division KSB1 bacterium]
MKILLKNIEKPDYTGSIQDYMKEGGYTAISKALKEMTPEKIVEDVKKSGIRGRGGAGFPTGVKWGFIPKNTDMPIYFVINADESEPGTFKDRIIIEKDPHLLIEGIIISSYAIKSHQAYIYIRGEFVYGANVLETAIKEAIEGGYVGRNILGTGYDLDIRIHRGAGAYICGEETGLIESLEGKRGWPRNKPPFPAVEGLFGCPTIVNNVETLANIPFIVLNSGDVFAKIGVKNSTGTKLFCLSGHINNPGVLEFPLGISLRELIYEHGGGIVGNKELKGVIPGGSSMPILTADEIDVPMDFDSLADVGTSLGSAGVIVMDETVDMVDAALNIAKFYAHESCGQCTPCREGMPWMRNILARIKNNKGSKEDIDTLLDICDNIEGKTICPFGEAGAWPIRTFVNKFREDFEKHIN